jgi:hypothetical protein
MNNSRHAFLRRRTADFFVEAGRIYQSTRHTAVDLSLDNKIGENGAQRRTIAYSTDVKFSAPRN